MRISDWSSDVCSSDLFPMQQEGTFLLGALAGMMSETRTISYVGGDQYPNIINIFEGYKQGAKYVDPDIEVIGTYLGDFDNPRSEERRVGKECVSTFRSRWSPLN